MQYSVKLNKNQLKMVWFFVTQITARTASDIVYISIILLCFLPENTSYNIILILNMKKLDKSYFCGANKA